MSGFTLGQPVSFNHPAGRVQGTIVKVDKNAVLVHVHTAPNMPRVELKFTLRDDEVYRQAGKGNRSPVLEVRK